MSDYSYLTSLENTYDAAQEATGGQFHLQRVNAHVSLDRTGHATAAPILGFALELGQGDLFHLTHIRDAINERGEILEFCGQAHLADSC